MDHPEEIIDLLLTKYRVQKSRAHLQFEAAAMRGLILPDLIEIGHMNPGRWQRMADSFIEVGMGKPDFSLAGFIYDPNPPNQVENLKKIIIYGGVIGSLVLIATGGLLLGWLRLKKEISLRKLAEAEVRHLAYNDPLTGIPNLNTFLPYANKQLFVANRSEQKVALYFIDLNNFKEINDNFGHKTGDAALIHAARAISSVIRESDLAARIGGDEFVVLLVGIHSIEDTQRTTLQIQQAIAEAFTILEHEFTLTASVGVAIYPDDGLQVDELMTKADAAMYKNKTEMKAKEKCS